MSKSLLKPLSRSVYYLPAPTCTTGPSSSSSPGSSATLEQAPRLLIVFGWMDAQLKHVEKYLTSYRKLFPSSPILLLQSSQKGFYSAKNQAETKQAFAPAIEIIRQQQLEGSLQVVRETQQERSSGILLHVFSNGGCMSLKWLNEEIIRSRARSSESSEKQDPVRSSSASTLVEPAVPIPATAVIFDSCPGRSSLLVTMRAFSAPIRNKVFKIPAMGFLAIFHTLISLYNFVRRKPSILDRLYHYLNLTSTLPPVPRLYLYSKIDELIPYRDVEEHGQTAKEQGVQVEMVKFDKTTHVGHARTEPEKYWTSIEKLWREANRPEK